MEPDSRYVPTHAYITDMFLTTARPIAKPEHPSLYNKLGMRMCGENVMFYLEISGSVGPQPAGK